MRLLLLSFGIVIAFGIGAWGIATMLPADAPEWSGVALSMIWLFLLVFGASLVSSRDRTKVHDQRRLLGYSLLAAVLMAAFLTPVFMFHIKVSRWVAEVILGAIAGAVFLFSNYMQCRKLDGSVR